MGKNEVGAQFHYPKVEFKEMWDTANFELPPIRVMLQKILEEE